MFESKIDRLDKTQKRLERSLEDKKSEINYINSRLGAKIKKLEEEAYNNRVDLENFEKEIALKLDKNAALIRAEAEYARKLGAKYKQVENNEEDVTKKGKGKK